MIPPNWPLAARRLLSSVTAAALLLLLPVLLVLPAGCGPDAAPRPNIVVYLVDTLRQDHLGVYGYERPTSPRLDALAEDSVVFRQAFAPSSWTKASTASILTGMHPIHHGATSRTSRLSEDATLLAQYLEPLGYSRQAVVTNPFVVGHWGFDRGYDEFLDLGERAPGAQGWQHVTAEMVHRRAFHMLDQRPADQPFFLYLHTIDVHGPNNPKPPYDTLFTDAPKPPGQAGRLTPDQPGRALETIDLYDAEIRSMDDQLGAFLDELKARGLYENTVIWFVSDHGEEFLDHGRGGHGTQLFNETVVVPLMVKLPFNESAGTVVDTPVSVIDLVPTQLALLGETPPPTVEGMDLRDVMAGDDAPRPLFFDLNLISGPEQALHVSSGVFYERLKYVEESLPEPRTLLFDLETDPGELNNMAQAKPGKARELAALLKLHRASRRSGLVLAAVGDKAAGGRTVEVRLATDGRFVDTELFEHEGSDAVEFEPGGGSVVVRLDLTALENNVMKGVLVQDIDWVNLRVEPPDARVTVEAFTVSGTDGWPVFRGTDRVRDTVPTDLSADDDALLTDDLGMLFGESERNPTSDNNLLSIPPGLYIVSLRGVDADLTDIPADMHQRLKELGYVR